jgi:hypothetical protein
MSQGLTIRLRIFSGEPTSESGNFMIVGVETLPRTDDIIEFGNDAYRVTKVRHLIVASEIQDSAISVQWQTSAQYYTLDCLKLTR